MNIVAPSEKFDALTVPLHDSNLIEASAGTGKTYSIAIMLLRLLLEKNIAINEILTVTFTKAAVAELEERIRLFVRSAYRVSLGETIDDETITKLVNTAIDKNTEANVRQTLKTAILFLDETSVLTIHSFCQQTLTAFAFETNQLFGSETLQDASSVIAEEVNKFWRETITTIPVELLSYLMEASLSRESITSVVKEHLNGKKYIDYDAAKEYALNNCDYEEMLKAINDFAQKENELKNCLHEHVEKNKDQIINSSKGNSYITKNVLPLINKAEDFVEFIWEKRNLANVIKVFETTLLPQIVSCKNVMQERDEHLQQVKAKINCFAINFIITGIRDYKQRNNLLSFDDLILDLHKALFQHENSNLISGLRKKYKAVFIDEFQDTDRLQYEIFQKTFGEDTILFYIGDPKQSIYAWRKADIFTYFKAQQQVNHLYNMNLNFRSSQAMIQAMNIFFLPDPHFDTFAFGNAEKAIRYLPVQSPETNAKGTLLINSQPDIPISILQLNNKESICSSVAEVLADLFSKGKYSIAKDGKERKVAPSDIGILVRTNGEGQLIKAALATKGIPAITINDAKVLESPEAVFLLHLLQAINNITPAFINKALLSPFTGYAVSDILELDDEKAMSLFRKYKNVYDTDGVYAALIQFIADYNVRKVLLAGNNETGERTITNLYQLIELIHKVQNDKRFSFTELIGWLKRGIEGMETEGDQYEQRVESDEEAVKIVTIHKSKGLEYNIVIAPFLDFSIERKNQKFCSFRHPETGDYVSVEKDRLTEQQKQWLDEQTEQENRRLVYVTITRAVYKCFIFQNTYYKNSTLTLFVNAISPDAVGFINFIKPPNTGSFYIKNEKWHEPPLHKSIDFTLLQKNWNRLSYTMLAAKGEILSKPRTGKGIDKYDQFIFNQLIRGAKTGNMLHYVFENIDFTVEKQWSFYVSQAIKRFAPRLEKEYTPMLLQLIQHIVQTTLTIDSNSFRLADVPVEKRLNELEFDFNVPLFSPSVLNDFQTNDTSISTKYFEEAEGIMNGKVDMFFEHNNMYYILDWKSNYLGDDVKYYEPSALQAAMNENNYHLQYLIYTVAVKKYLQSRLPSFNYDTHFGGVIYLFIRGVRSSGNTGIFVKRPPLSQIEKMEKILSE